MAADFGDLFSSYSYELPWFSMLAHYDSSLIENQQVSGILCPCQLVRIKASSTINYVSRHI